MIFTPTVINLGRIQHVEGERYKSQAEKNQLHDTEISAERGVIYDANGTKDYFLPTASIIDRDNEIKMICAAKNCTEAEAEKYEIVWYVIKLQHNPGSGWFSKATTEWHIDGVIKKKANSP